MAKRKLKVHFRIPQYISPRNQWRQLIYQRSRQNTERTQRDRERLADGDVDRPARENGARANGGQSMGSHCRAEQLAALLRVLPSSLALQ